MRIFAEDHEAWQESFFNAWEKMQQNGYHQWELTQASDNGHLLSQTEWYDYKGHSCGFLSPGIQNYFLAFALKSIFLKIYCKILKSGC